MGLGAFGNKTFEVKLNKIYTFNDLSVSESLNVEQQETEGGKPATYIKGMSEMSVSFGIILLSRFCDVESEINWWFKKMRSKTPEYLTLGTKRYGTNKMLLQSVSLADTVILSTGTYTAARVDLKFSEWTKKGQKKVEASGGTGSGGSGSGGTGSGGSGSGGTGSGGSGSGGSGSGGSGSGGSGSNATTNEKGLVKISELKTEFKVGSNDYVEKNKTIIDGAYYYVQGSQYYPMNYIKDGKADGGRTKIKVFPKGTPVYGKTRSRTTENTSKNTYILPIQQTIMNIVSR